MQHLKEKVEGASETLQCLRRDMKQEPSGYLIKVIILIEVKLINYMEMKVCLLYLNVMTAVSAALQKAPQNTEMSLEK